MGYNLVTELLFWDKIHYEHELDAVRKQVSSSSSLLRYQGAS